MCGGGVIHFLFSSLTSLWIYFAFIFKGILAYFFFSGTIHIFVIVIFIAIIVTIIIIVIIVSLYLSCKIYYAYIYLCIYLSICLSICLSTYLAIHLFIYLSIYLASLSMCTMMLHLRTQTITYIFGIHAVYPFPSSHQPRT